MEEYTICTKCVMDTSDPDIKFDEKGVCNHCYSYDEFLNKFSDTNKNQKELDLIINRIKIEGAKKDYDCIIGVSGGVDSTYVAYLVKKMGLRPLAVHLDNGWNSELAVNNIENTLKNLDIDLYTYVIDWEEFRDIQVSFLYASTPDAEIPTDHAIFEMLKKIAKKQRVKYIISGINNRTESHHTAAWSRGHSDWKYIKSIHNRFGKLPIKSYPHGNFLTLVHDRFNDNLINVLDYIDYNKEQAKKIIEQELGWRDYGGKHFESIYTRFFQGYILPKKFGFDKRRTHLSSLICAGQLSREQALIELSKPTYPENMQLEDKEYVIKKFGFSSEVFNKIMESPVLTFFDYPSYYGKLLNSPFIKNLWKALKKLK